MYTEIEKNKNKTIILLLGFVIFAILVSVFLGYVITFDVYSSVISGLIGFSISLILTFITYFFGDKITLSSVNAIEITNDPNYKELNDLVETLAIKSGLPKPRVYILPEKALNAFATGRNPQKSHVALTQGLIENLDREELSAVIAHELAHIKNYDIRLMLIVSVIAGTLTFIADVFLQTIFFKENNNQKEIPFAFYLIILIIGILIALLLPLVGTLVQLAISRRREFLADATAVEITRYPEGMIKALKKIAESKIPVQKATEGNAHLFFSNPLKSNFLSNLFSTHPPIEERIKAIQKIFI